MVPDPLSEKYYGISPYAYCNNNPLSFTDPYGEDALDVLRGFWNSISTNATNGLIGNRETGLSNATNEEDYLKGEVSGDILSLILGAAEIGTGGGMMTGGETATAVAVAASPATAGATLVISPVGIAVSALGATLIGHGAMMMANASNNLEKGNNTSTQPAKPKFMQRLVEKGQAPKTIDRFDEAPKNIKNGKPHVHFKDGGAINVDGTIHDKSKSHNLTKKEREFLEKYGWKVNPQN